METVNLHPKTQSWKKHTKIAMDYQSNAFYFLSTKKFILEIFMRVSNSAENSAKKTTSYVCGIALCGADIHESINARIAYLFYAAAYLYCFKYHKQTRD